MTPEAPVGLVRALTPTPRRLPQPVQRTPHATAAPIQHMRVDHRRTHIPVAKQLLDRPDVIAGLEQMRRKRMPQRVARASCSTLRERR